MKDYITQDFLLSNEAGRVLYHDYASDMPIFDYHNHLNPRDIAEDVKYENISQIWLRGDHYKWRAMRNLGVDERLITGDATDFEKYLAWAGTVPYTVGNVLYQWTHMELQVPFGISGVLLGPDTAEQIWERTRDLLQQDEYSVCSILRRLKARAVCTTDDPVDNLEHHSRIRNQFSDIRVVPTFRPDNALGVENPDLWNAYRVKLGEAANLKVESYSAFVEALDRRHSFFHEQGGRATDHAIVTPFAEKASKDDLEKIFKKLVSREELSNREILQFKTASLCEVGRMNHKRGWVMQLHMSAQRDNNSRLLSSHGTNAGFNSIADEAVAAPLARFLDLLDRTDELPKTILYSLNANQNDVLATMAGNFIDGRVPGKVQLGAPWWFNDQKDGIERHLTSVSNMGLMSTYLGMLTDTVNVFSFVRHDYFRRIVCNLVGRWIEDGDIPHDTRLVGGIIQDICYNNACRFFNLEGMEPIE